MSKILPWLNSKPHSKQPPSSQRGGSGCYVGTRSRENDKKDLSNDSLLEPMTKMLTGMYIQQLEGHNDKPLYRSRDADADEQYLRYTKQGWWAFGDTPTPHDDTSGVWSVSTAQGEEFPTSCRDWRISGT